MIVKAIGDDLEQYIDASTIEIIAFTNHYK